MARHQVVLTALRLALLAVLVATSAGAQSKDQKALAVSQHALELQVSATKAAQVLLELERAHSRDLNATIGRQMDTLRDVQGQLATATDQVRTAGQAAAATASKATSTAAQLVELQTQAAKALEVAVGEVKKAPAAALVVSVGKLTAQSKVQADTAEGQRVKAADEATRRADEATRRADEQKRFQDAQTKLQDASRREIREGFARQNWAMVITIAGLVVMMILFLVAMGLLVSWLAKHKVEGEKAAIT